MQDHKPDPLALSQTQSAQTVGVKSVREAFAAAPVTNPDTTIGIRLHIQVDEQVTFNPLSGATPPVTSTRSRSPPALRPASNASTTRAQGGGLRHHQGGELRHRHRAPGNSKTLNAKRLAFRYVRLRPQPGRHPGGGSNGSGCSEIGGDDAVSRWEASPQTTVNNVKHNRGTTDQQAGTFMHEFGHILGFGHGGDDNINCKPNYRSVMSYTRQFAGSPIPNRRLDYSRSDGSRTHRPPDLTGVLNESGA